MARNRIKTEKASSEQEAFLQNSDKKRGRRRRKQKKDVTLVKMLLRGIAFILALSILIPILVYEYMPEWIFLLTPSVSLRFAGDEIRSSADSPEFVDILKDVSTQYDSNIEIFDTNGRFVYSSTAQSQFSSLEFPLTSMPELDDVYKLKYISDNTGENDAGSDFEIKYYITPSGVKVNFLVYMFKLNTGERVEMCMQTSSLNSSTKVTFAIFFFLMMGTLFFALAIIAAYLNKFSRSIKELCRITDNMAKLDFTQQCPPAKAIELAQLSNNINNVSDALNVALLDLKQKNEKLLKDIEDERTLDNLRQTFFSGVSHELKTPIAIIQGYAEGARMYIDSGDNANAHTYCQVIGDEAQRMNTMVVKLLEITKYESGAIVLQREDFSISRLFSSWFERNGQILTEKGIRSRNLIPEIFSGNGDPLILSSVVNNYLSNAVSHCAGDKLITVNAADMGEKYRVSVINTGENIAKKDIDKIWQSFYRADKALSRSQGRFGLGLAIVSSIQRVHGMECGVNNIDGGVEFWFDVKKSDPEG